MKKVLIISTSLRENGNSETLAKSFAKGAESAGNTVETIGLSKKNIEFCNACLACLPTHRCVKKDDMENIVTKMKDAEVLVFATPIYFYGMSGQMKTFLDRTNPLYSADFKFRDIYLLAASADPNKTAIEGAVKGMEGWISCFPKTRLAGTLHGAGIDELGEIQKLPEVIREAFEMGEKV